MRILSYTKHIYTNNNKFASHFIDELGLEEHNPTKVMVRSQNENEVFLGDVQFFPGCFGRFKEIPCIQLYKGVARIYTDIASQMCCAHAVCFQ